MEQIASDGRRVFYLRVLAPGEGIDAPFGGDPYPALTWATVPTTDEQKASLCTDLIASGCRYVVCAGEECEAWEETADEVIIARERLQGEEVPDAEFVMTVSRTDETMDDVGFYFVRCTRFGKHDFTRYIVLLIGDDVRIRGPLIATIRQYVGGKI